MKNQELIIRRRSCYRLLGVSKVAAVLKVSKAAVSNFVSGRCPSSISRDKALRIKIIDEN